MSKKESQLVGYVIMYSFHNILKTNPLLPLGDLVYVNIISVGKLTLIKDV